MDVRPADALFVLSRVPTGIPGRNPASTNSLKSAWEVTPYYTRAYEKGCLFVRGDKPRELAEIAKITARQWNRYQNGRHRENPILKGLQYLRAFEDESVRTYAQAAEVLGVSRERVYQLTSLVTRLPPKIKDFLAARKIRTSCGSSLNGGCAH